MFYCLSKLIVSYLLFLVFKYRLQLGVNEKMFQAIMKTGIFNFGVRQGQRRSRLLTIQYLESVPNVIKAGIT